MFSKTFINLNAVIFCMPLMDNLLVFTKAEKPINFFLISFIYSIVLLVISYFVFSKYAGILSVFLVSLALLPIVSKYLTHA
ncbi:MAG: hypothetical protein ABIA76_02995, partial [Candidatus Diapherotrites archaeon]